MSNKIISISLSPNIFPQDIRAASLMLADKDHWQEGDDLLHLQNAFAKYLGMSDKEGVFLFNSGRSALLGILRAFGIGRGDEVLLQAFTCNAVPNPVIWAGAMPVYVDVDEHTYNIKVTDIEKNITPKTKAIIIQHTFGLAGPIREILTIAKRYNLVVIEDCAHALGTTCEGKKVGLLGDAAFFSFGRDKVISSVYGGVAVFHNQQVKKEMGRIYQEMPYPSLPWIRQQLRHPIIVDRLLKWYAFPFSRYGVGKLLLQISQGTKLLSKAVHWTEKQGSKPDYFPAKLPNALARLARLQLDRVDTFNTHRRELAQLYHDELNKFQVSSFKFQHIQEGHIYLRYPVRHLKAHEIITKARLEGLLLGDWYTTPVAPEDTQLEKVFYKKGSCPVAETLALDTLNLPTNPNLSLQDAARVVEFLRECE